MNPCCLKTVERCAGIVEGVNTNKKMLSDLFKSIAETIRAEFLEPTPEPLQPGDIVTSEDWGDRNGLTIDTILYKDDLAIRKDVAIFRNGNGSYYFPLSRLTKVTGPPETPKPAIKVGDLVTSPYWDKPRIVKRIHVPIGAPGQEPNATFEDFFGTRPVSELTKVSLPVDGESIKIGDIVRHPEFYLPHVVEKIIPAWYGASALLDNGYWRPVSELTKVPK
jgi:hypothetical protein